MDGYSCGGMALGFMAAVVVYMLFCVFAQWAGWWNDG